MHLDDNTASLSYKDSTVPQLKGSVVTSLLLKEIFVGEKKLITPFKKLLYLFTSVEMSMTQDSSSNKSESSQLTAEGWCRSKLVIECEFDFESCNVMGNRARVFLNKQSERIHFDENTSHSVFHLRTTVPWLLPDSETPALYLARPERFLDNIRKGNFCREPT